MSESTTEAQPLLGGLLGKSASPAAKACKLCSCCCLVLVGVLLVAFLICTLGYSEPSIATPVVENALAGDPVVNWWNMPEQQPWSVLQDLKANLSNVTDTVADNLTRHVGFTTGVAGPEEAATLMYKATRVDGIWERVPQKFRGVFWMSGNGVAEELLSLQYGRWFEDQRTYVAFLAPFSWSWPLARPKEAPFAGAMYTEGAAMQNAIVMITPGITFSFVFRSSDMKYALMQTYLLGNLNVNNDLGLMVDLILQLPAWLAGFASGHFDLTEMDGPEPGSIWKRGILWGLRRCKCLPFGSYELKKVLDADGKPLEPYWSEYVKYMHDDAGNPVPLLLWSGFRSKENRTAAAQSFTRCAARPDLSFDILASCLQF